MINPFAIIGRTTLAFLAAIGRLAMFTGNGVMHTFLPPFYFGLIWRQMLAIGYYSLPVVGLTAFFTGAVLALQIYVGSARFNAESAVASIVVIGLVRELGPVLGGLMVGGRVGAAIAAELGTMRVTEQIDALITLQTNPFKYLVAPRLIAATITMPMLVLIADIIGVLRRLHGRRAPAGLQRRLLHQEHLRVPGSHRRDLRPGEGGRSSASSSR